MDIQLNMTRYCNQCGAEISDEDEQFCSNCGSNIHEKTTTSGNTSHTKIIIILLCIIVGLLILSITFMSFGNIFSPKETPTLEIITGSQMTNEETFKVELVGKNGALQGKNIKVTFSDGENSYDFVASTNANGIAEITPTVDLGDYEVVCEFEGDDDYSQASTTKPVTVVQAEPNYESYSYSHSFEDTDSNGDGYVTLSDMNIAHTPKNIQNQMYSDSDDDGDGKLNRHEYYKFMYKLNYDKGSYGL